MSSYSLHQKTFYNAQVSADSGTWYPVDWNFNGIQQRSIIGTKNTADDIVVELRNLDPTDQTITVITTATVWSTGVTSFSSVITGPFNHIRVRKVGASGAATVIGLV